MFDRISSVGNAGRVSAREQMAREVLGVSVFPYILFTDGPRWASVHATYGGSTLRPLYYDV